jgi:soluble lytic murein transglycosylase-like protein
VGRRVQGTCFATLKEKNMSANMNGSWPDGSTPYREKIQAAAMAAEVPVLILAWLLWQESHYRDDIIRGKTRSPKGALGIAQFMPATAREVLGSEAAALDPNKAIPGAAYYLARLYKATGSWKSALAAYNWGIGNVKNQGLTNLPSETSHYISTIMNGSGYATLA